MPKKRYPVMMEANEILDCGCSKLPDKACELMADCNVCPFGTISTTIKQLRARFRKLKKSGKHKRFVKAVEERLPWLGE